MKKSFNDFLIETLETRVRTSSEERRKERYARMLLDAHMKRLDQLAHKMIVQEHAERFTKQLSGQ